MFLFHPGVLRRSHRDSPVSSHFLHNFFLGEVAFCVAYYTIPSHTSTVLFESGTICTTIRTGTGFEGIETLLICQFMF